MNEEKNTTENSSESSGANGDNTFTSKNNPQSSATLDADVSGTPKDEYYAVDHVKKEVLSTIGDGEMHDEGLVGEGEVTTTNLQSSTERLSDEQDEAELHDNEG